MVIYIWFQMIRGGGGGIIPIPCKYSKDLDEIKRIPMFYSELTNSQYIAAY